LEQELANERELRQELEDAAQDGTLVQSLERIIARHSAERAASAAAWADERARWADSLRDATIRHEQAIMALVTRHRGEISDRLDRVLAQNAALFAQISTTANDLWKTRGTTRPSLSKEHWLLLAREDTQDKDGTPVATFKIHSGQKAYIDRIRRNKEVLLSQPAANGVDVRQSAKKRLREKTAEETVSARHTRGICWN
jgi:hypothetical protein